MEQLSPGKMSKEQYDAYVGDLVNFMVYMGEPMQTERKSLGIWVLLFLSVFTVIAYFLKKEYWKDIH
jgi:ubiquinol-cytochrome c reductase cytochrome c1 subunit